MGGDGRENGDAKRERKGARVDPKQREMEIPGE
jgi:hypothetical protein